MSLSSKEIELELARLACGLELAERAARRLGIAPGMSSGALPFRLAALAIRAPGVRRLELEEKGLAGEPRSTVEEIVRIRSILDRVR